MKDSEEAIEKVLAGLRDAEAPEGMERRILDALENGAAVRTESVWHRLLPLWLLAPAGAMTRVLVCGAALAGVAVVVFAASAIRHAGSSPVQAKKEVAPAILLPIPSAVMDAPSVAASSSREERAGLRVRGTVGETQSVRTVDAEDSVALSEMRAASFPAPPMPLTEQEKLLLRIVHKGDPVEVALLDPNQRNLQEMNEKAEYQSFFARHAIEQPTTGQTPEQAVPASDPADGKQLEGQQQIPSEQDDKNGNDNSKNKTRERQNE